MVNPERHIKDYLDKLIKRYASITLYKKQLEIIAQWKRPDRIETLNKGATFFDLVNKSFSRTYLIELCLLVSPKEKYNLCKWLESVKIHSSSLEPTRADRNNNSTNKRIKINNNEYLKIVDEHISALSNHNSTIDKLTALREKIFTHYDPDYFKNPEKTYRKYLLTKEELDNLINTIEDILSSHHSYLFSVSIPMFDVASYSNVDMILKFTRAFMRIRADKKLIIDKVIKPADYLRDTFNDKEA